MSAVEMSRTGAAMPADRTSPLAGAAIAIICVAAIVMRRLDLQSSDVAWLMSGAEWLLDGRVFSRDFFEVNPPGSVLLYMPAVVLGRAIGLPVETMHEILVFALAGLVICMAALRLAAASGRREDGLVLAAALTLVLLVLPSHAFGQREHFGLLFLVPCIALAATPDVARSRLMQTLAGAGIGLAGVAKPHLLLIPAVLQAWEIWRARSLRPALNIANTVAVVVLTLYALAVVHYFPDFIAIVLPRAADVYVPVRRSLLELMSYRGASLWLILIAGLFASRVRDGRLTYAGDVLLAASLAGGLVYLLQGKGFNYHIYPAFACALAALALRLIDNLERLQGHLARVATGGLALAFTVWGVIYFDTPHAARNRALAREIVRIEPAPRLLMLSPELETGFPLTRMTGGVWVQRQPFLWLAYGAMKLADRNSGPDYQAMLARYDRLERDILMEDIGTGRPNIILAETSRDRDWLAWAQADARLAELLRAYRPVLKAGDITVLQLVRDAPAPDLHPRRNP